MFGEANKVLDHGLVRLVDYMGSDLSIVRNARVSYDAAWRAGENKKGDEGLISYLMKNGHNTPFESVTFTFEIKAPIFVLRQWHRHRTQSYNELSARYRELPEQFYVPEAHTIGVQNADNKQMRDVVTKKEYEKLPEFAKLSAELIRKTMIEQNTQAFSKYKQMIVDEVPRELARTILPLSTYSHMFVTVNLHNLFHFLRERLHEHAQYEIQEYAKVILDEIENIVPVAVKYFKETLK